MILYVDDNRTFPPDIRVEKEAKALSKAGHEVFILTLLKPGFKNVEFIDALGATVIRVVITHENILKKLTRFWNMYDKRWEQPIGTFIENYQIDVLHVHDLPMVPTTLGIAKKYHKPVVADLHENMPAAFAAYRTGMPPLKRLVSLIVHNYWRMKKQEARYLPECDHVIVVVEEAIERIKGYGLPTYSISVVANSEDETSFRFRPDEADNKITEIYERYWTVSYIGGIGPHRGLDIALKAVPFIGNRIPNFQLLIVGANDQAKKWINREVERLDIAAWVKVVGWQPFSKVNSYVVASDVCLVPHKDFEHTQEAIPHKLFQYMICSKPVLVSSCKPLKRVVEDTKAGRVFDIDNPLSMAEELVWMYDNPDECQQFGRNGHEAALGKYAWKNDADRLVSIYDNIKR